MQLFLKKGREESLLRFHPWVFSGAVDRIHGKPAEGDVVEVHAYNGDFLATGHYQDGSIMVRVLGFKQRAIDAAFWEEALRKARLLREKILSPVTSCYRLVHGEGDGLPGLVIDIYGDTAVLQAHSIGMFRARPMIVEALRKIYGDKLTAIYDKSSGTLGNRENEPAADGYLYRSAAPSGEVQENGYRFAVDWEQGQKTGFFLDQRDNRKLLELYAAGRSVLNLFCYTGGFSVYALGGGATLVHSVDSSQRAIDMVEKNIQFNHPSRVTCHASHTTDAIDFLRNVQPDVYDLMVLDPPAFAKHKGALKNALQAYKRLNAAAFTRIASGGIVFTFSCSQVVSSVDFRNAIFSAAALSGRQVRILHQLTQPADHPVNIYHPEGEYLKGLVLHVE